MPICAPLRRCHTDTTTPCGISDCVYGNNEPSVRSVANSRSSAPLDPAGVTSARDLSNVNLLRLVFVALAVLQLEPTRAINCPCLVLLQTSRCVLFLAHSCHAIHSHEYMCLAAVIFRNIFFCANVCNVLAGRVDLCLPLSAQRFLVWNWLELFEC